MDDLGRGGDDGSLATGNAGARCLENTICDKNTKKNETQILSGLPA